MRITVIKCEECDQIYPLLSPESGVHEYAPADWITLFRGTPHLEDDGWHFCSQQCLGKWATGYAVGQAPSVAPRSKVRRFLLIDGETAEETEGVKWSSGEVTLEPREGHTRHFRSWDILKHDHPGDGVQWIDQEVSA